MEIKEANFLPVLFGSDINTYSVARAFHEAYGIKSVVIGKYNSGPSCNSKIIDFNAVPNIENDDIFLSEVNKIVEKNKDKKIILLGCGDNYLALIARNKSNFASNVIVPYISSDQMSLLTHKEKFYELCEKNNIPYPKTFIFKKGMPLDSQLPFDFPVILKPAESVSYWNNSFSGQKKVYKINSQEGLKSVINEIYNAGYSDSLIIQDFIPGDDSNMRVLTCYSDKNAKVKMMALGHVLLEEHTPKGLGNHAVIINEYNEKILDLIKNFLESINYVGFSNFDIKFDSRDSSYRIFEINVRQGRSNFYVTCAGTNISKLLVDDYVLNKPLEYHVVKNKMLWHVIPLFVAFGHVKDLLLKNEMRELIKSQKDVNPLFYKGDMGLRRLIPLLKNHFSHFFKYRKYYK